MSEPLLMAEMTWPEVAQSVEEGTPVALIVGATEQHGPHLPLGTDVLCAFELLKRVARHVPLVLAPPLTYGYKSRPFSGGGQHFVGTTSLAATTLIALVRDVVGEFLRHGWPRILVVQEHLENQTLVYEGIDLAVREYGTTGSKIVLVEDWLAELAPADLAELFPDGFPGWAAEHAAVMETSAMLALRPDLVHESRRPADTTVDYPCGYDIIPPVPAMIPSSGVLAPASSASRAKGEIIVREGERYFLALLKREFGLD